LVLDSIAAGLKKEARKRAGCRHLIDRRSYDAPTRVAES
jgi:hypothetical protein